MLVLVLGQLRHELARTLIRALAIAAVVAEILILEGFLGGLYSQLRTAVVNRGGDLVVTQAGVSNFIAARSILPQFTREQVEAVSGVARANPLTGLSVIYEQGGRRTPIMVLVYDTAGGPRDIIEGHRIAGDREIVIDRALATKYHLSPGDAMELSSFRFTVAGVSTNTSAFLTPFAFINYDDLIDFYFESDIAEDIATFPLLSFLLVEVEDGAEPRQVASDIEQAVPVADVFLPQELALRDEGLGRELMGPILGLLLAVSYGIGVLVVGMFTFAAVHGRVGTLGVLRALGVRVRALVGAVLLEAVLLTLLALPVGIGVGYLAAEVIDQVAPIYLILVTEPWALVRTTVACLGFAALGALVPVRTVTRIDPARAFRS